MTLPIKTQAADRSYPLENQHQVLSSEDTDEIRIENENIDVGDNIASVSDMPTEQEIREALLPKSLDSGMKSTTKDNLVKYPPTANTIRNETRAKSGEGDTMGNFLKWLVTDPKKAHKEPEGNPHHNENISRIESRRVDTKAVPPATKPVTIKKESQPDISQTPPSVTPITNPVDTTVVEQATTKEEKPHTKKSGISGFVDKQLDSFGESIVEQEKKKKAESEKKSARKKDLVGWFLGKKPEGQQTADPSSPLSPENSNSSGKEESAKKDSTYNLFFGALSGNKKTKEKDDLPPFEIGTISQPSLDGPLTDIDVTYAVSPPFIYVRIKFDGEEVVYNVLEPALGEVQQKRLGIIEKNLEKMISSKIVAIKAEEREVFLRQKFEEIIQMFNWKLTEAYKDRMFFYLRKKYLGYDRIEVLMKDHYIEDVSCNGPNNYLYIFHRIYGSIRSTISYGDVELNRFVMRMAQISGKHISILQPIKDIALPDGSRANLTLGTEVTKKGATFTIRKFKERPISPIELIEYNSIDPALLAYLWTLLYYKRSILVSGGTASGKTTLMNVLCSFIKPENKIVSLEDTPELNLYHPNWIQSVTRTGFGGESGGAAPASGTSHQGGKSAGDISMYELLAAALRQRPEYILVGEVRGAEAFTLFQAIAVGHAAMGTIHAGSMRELLSRVESNPMNVPRTLFASMDCVVFPAQVRRNDRNVRRVMQAVEILELDTDGDLVTNLAFRWDAFSDKFVFGGRSHIFEKIEAQLGIRQEELIKDMGDRAAFLQDLRDRGIKDYYQVVDQIREYELNKLSSRQSKK